ncbi:LysR family transcriptional regulator [Streptomyces sp. NPDC046557]|uniref:LysR family transcriptional regulator n=1 Tax=Streptomyces sp. NPDC046557 TaxID=3155372 RepID=UPI0033CC1C31
MIEARHLRVLRTVVQTGSFTAAAHALGCTQPAVSQQIKALENYVQTPLLVRTGGRAVRPTEAGEILVRHATKIFTGLAAAEEEMANLAGRYAWRVRLVSFLSGTSQLLPAALSALRAKRPNINVSFTEAAPTRAVEMLRDGDCEIALAFHYPGTPDFGKQAVPAWEGLVVHPLLTDRLVLVTPSDHHLANRERIGLSELSGEPWVAGCPSCRRHLVDLCEAEGFSPRIDLVTDDYPAVIALVAAGLGIAALPEMALDGRVDAVRFLRLEPVVRREIVALTLPEFEFIPAVAALTDELKVTARSLGGALGGASTEQAVRAAHCAIGPRAMGS